MNSNYNTWVGWWVQVPLMVFLIKISSLQENSQNRLGIKALQAAEPGAAQLQIPDDALIMYNFILVFLVFFFQLGEDKPRIME